MEIAAAAEASGNPENEMDSSQQFVTFQIADEIFGFPMATVLEIIRLPHTVGVPMTHEALVGLANLRGSILPILNLRRVLKLDSTADNDATRVVVTDVGSPVGLVVDRVLRVMNVEMSQIEPKEQVQSDIDSNLVDGVIKGKDKEPLIQLLNAQHLITQQFSTIIASAAKQLDSVTGQRQSSFQEDEEKDDAEQLVSFTIDGQEYAFDLMEVEEIVRVPDDISKIPQTEEYILGLIDLRGRLLPLVNLRNMFALSATEMNEDNRILVISVQAPGGIKYSVGLVVDDVKEVIRISQDLQDEVPSLFAENKENLDIAKICRLDNGQRLVSVLRGETMFSHSAIQAALQAGNHGEESDKNMVTDDLQLDTENSDEMAQLVIFNLGDQEYGVSIDDVQEITRIPEKLDKVPKSADFIEGMVNLRGTVLPVVDMRSRFGMEKMTSRTEQQRIVVLNLNGTKTGFIVDSVAEVLRLQHDQIEKAPNLSADQARIMGHVINLKEEKRMIQVITAQELLTTQEIININNNNTHNGEE